MVIVEMKVRTEEVAMLVKESEQYAVKTVYGELTLESYELIQSFSSNGPPVPRFLPVQCPLRVTWDNGIIRPPTVEKGAWEYGSPLLHFHQPWVDQSQLVGAM